MIFNMKTLTVSIIFLCICFLIISGIDTELYSLPASVNHENKVKIIIDAGHGGFDGGAEAADGTKEKNINLSIALKLQKFLTLGGFDVIMTRTEDTGTEENENDTISKRKVSDMRKRLEIIKNNPDAAFVSVHLNKFTTSTCNGAQVFYSPNNENSLTLAQNLQSSIVTMLQPDNERVVKKSDDSIYLLNNAEIPAVIIECGFLSNGGELAMLKDNEYQSKMAFSIYLGILDYYG